MCVSALKHTCRDCGGGEARVASRVRVRKIESRSVLIKVTMLPRRDYQRTLSSRPSRPFSLLLPFTCVP